MFSGIVDHCGTILALEQQTNSIDALIECTFTNLTEGESIAVDGICLTAVAPQAQRFLCNISPETLQLTTAQTFAVGRKINLERALCMGDRIGGHWITGHIDQTAKIVAIRQQQEYLELQIGGLSAATMPYLIKKGSIALNGVSLTINEILADGLKVLLIPHTLLRTNLGQLSVGDNINLEFDWMTRVIINHLQQHPMMNS